MINPRLKLKFNPGTLLRAVQRKSQVMKIIGIEAAAQVRANIDSEGRNEQGAEGTWVQDPGRSKAAEKRLTKATLTTEYGHAPESAGTTLIDTGAMIGSIDYQVTGDKILVGPMLGISKKGFNYAAHLNKTWNYLMLPKPAQDNIVKMVLRFLQGKG